MIYTTDKNPRRIQHNLSQSVPAKDRREVGIGNPYIAISQRPVSKRHSISLAFAFLPYLKSVADRQTPHGEPGHVCQYDLATGVVSADRRRRQRETETTTTSTTITRTSEITRVTFSRRVISARISYSTILTARTHAHRGRLQNSCRRPTASHRDKQAVGPSAF